MANYLGRAKELAGDLIRIRRHIHQHPELSGQETQTAAYIAEELRRLGIEHIQEGVGRTGVVALIGDAKAGPAVLLRVDIDALPIHELNDVPYRSRVEGVMHACGHDAHCAIGIGAARLLYERRAELGGPVKIMFQPAEEALGGAQWMIDDGVLANPEVFAAVGIHVTSDMDVGQVRVLSGPTMAAARELRITVKGRAAHGAYPDQGIDAIVAAAHVVTALQTVVSRRVPGLQPAIVTIGTIHGGARLNVIADEVKLEGTVRFFDPTVGQTIEAAIRQAATGAAAALGAEAEVVLSPAMPALVANPRVAATTADACAEELGPEAVAREGSPRMASEDFARIAERVPSAHIRLGSKTPGTEARQGHNPYFDIDEACLPIGAALLAAAAHQMLVTRG